MNVIEGIIINYAYVILPLVITEDIKFKVW